MEILGLVLASSLIVLAATAISGFELNLPIFVLEVGTIMGLCGLMMVLI